MNIDEALVMAQREHRKANMAIPRTLIGTPDRYRAINLKLEKRSQLRTIVEARRVIRSMNRRLQKEHEKKRDNCEVCNGARGGVLGNENRVIVDGVTVVMCDYCSVSHSKLTRFFGREASDDA